jgi:hypothetical protein
MVHVLYTLNRQLYTNYSDLLISCARGTGKNHLTVYLLLPCTIVND